MNKKLLIGIIIIAILIVGGYFVFSKKVATPTVNYQQNSLATASTTENNLNKIDNRSELRQVTIQNIGDIEIIEKDIYEFLESKYEDLYIIESSIKLVFSDPKEAVVGGQIIKVYFEAMAKNNFVLEDNQLLKNEKISVESKASRGSTPYQWIDAPYHAWNVSSIRIIK